MNTTSYGGLFVLLFGVFLSACAAPTTPATAALLPSAPVCGETTGAISQQTLTKTTRGYDYNYEIYLPPCYETPTETSYPVLYLIPGRGGSAGDWFNAGIGQLADEMIKNAEIAPFIIVATDDTDADPMAEAIYGDLMPAVAQRYRTLPGRRFQAVAGGSLGGVAAYRLVFQHPDQFGYAGMFGSGVIHGEEDRVRAWLAAMPAAERPYVFLNTGEQDPMMMAQAEVMMRLLEDAGVTMTSIFSPGDHTYGYWAENMPAFLRILAADWTAAK